MKKQTLTLVTRPYLCTQCGKHDVVAGGYHVNIEHLPGMITLYAVEHGQMYDEAKFRHHVCGRACCVLAWNAAMDEMERPRTDPGTSPETHIVNPAWEVQHAG